MRYYLALGTLTVGFFAAERMVEDYKRMSETSCVTHHVDNGGCLDQFKAARLACQQRRQAGTEEADAEACVGATVALHECFAGNPEWFKHQYLRRMNEGLDQDTKPTPKEIKMAKRQGEFRWWTAMRRS